MTRNIAAFCLMLAFADCGHASEPPSPRLLEAIQYNHRGEAAFTRGDFKAALDWFDKALAVDTSIENTDGIALNLLNLARVYQALGQISHGHQRLDLILNEPALKFSSARLTEAATRNALLYLSQGKLQDANTWAGKAAGYCGTDCLLTGTILNVRANLALRNGNADAALNLAKEALVKNRDLSKAETANSLRLIAEARLSKKEFDAALVPLEEALELDKTLGLPEKIRLDLMRMSDAYRQLGKLELADAYSARALRIRGERATIAGGR